MASRIVQEPHTVVQDRLPVTEALRVLDAAYGGWGNQRLYEWKADYPRGTRDLFVEDEAVSLDGGVTAFARLYRRRAIVDGDPGEVVVRGNAAVHPDHQGEGRYTAIHRATERYCEARGVDGLFTYNRKDNRSFRTSLKSDWTARELPLYVNILSPMAALRAYGSDVSVPGADHPAVERLTEHVGVSVGGETIPLSAVIADSAASPTPRFGVTLSEQALDAFVERAANGGSPTELARTAAILLACGELSVTGRAGGSTTTRASESGVEPTTGSAVGHEEFDRPDRRSSAAGRSVERRPPASLSDAERERLVQLYESVHDMYDIYFERQRDDVDHLLNHPTLTTTYLAERDGELVGFAALATTAPEGVTEGRVLDLVGTDRQIKKALREAVEADARAGQIDLLALLSSHPPEERWIPIGRHVLAWDRKQTRATDRFRSGRWRLGFYDVV